MERIKRSFFFFFFDTLIQFRKTIVFSVLLNVSWEIIGGRKTRSRDFIHYLARPANRSRNRGQVSREKPRVARSRLVENHFPFSRLSRICDTIEQTFREGLGERSVGVPPSTVQRLAATPHEEADSEVCLIWQFEYKFPRKLCDTLERRQARSPITRPCRVFAPLSDQRLTLGSIDRIPCRAHDEFHPCKNSH